MDEANNFIENPEEFERLADFAIKKAIDSFAKQLSLEIKINFQSGNDTEGNPYPDIGDYYRNNIRKNPDNPVMLDTGNLMYSIDVIISFEEETIEIFFEDYGDYHLDGLYPNPIRKFMPEDGKEIDDFTGNRYSVAQYFIEEFYENIGKV